MTPIVYCGIVMLALYVALVGHGYIVGLAFIAGGIAFFLLQRYFYEYCCQGESQMDTDSEEDDDHFRLPPA